MVKTASASREIGKGAIPRSKALSFDDFCVLIKEHQKADLLDGAIFMASPESRKANQLFTWLLSLLEVYVRRRELGQIYGTRVAFRLDALNAPEPDIAFVVSERLSQPQQGYFDGAPDLAIEIVSAESVDRDYVTKRRKYREAGVREYWIIDQERKKVTWLRRDARSKFREVKAKKGVFHSQVIAGLWIKPAWFWQEPLPDLFEILTELLANEEE